VEGGGQPKPTVTKLWPNKARISPFWTISPF